MATGLSQLFFVHYRPQDYQDPFEKCVGKGNRASTMPGHGSVSVSYDMVDGKANLNQER